MGAKTQWHCGTQTKLKSVQLQARKISLAFFDALLDQSFLSFQLRHVDPRGRRLQADDPDFPRGVGAHSAVLAADQKLTGAAKSVLPIRRVLRRHSAASHADAGQIGRQAGGCERSDTSQMGEGVVVGDDGGAGRRRVDRRVNLTCAREPQVLPALAVPGDNATGVLVKLPGQLLVYQTGRVPLVAILK